MSTVTVDPGPAPRLAASRLARPARPGSWLLQAVAITALVEAVLLRGLTRTVVHIPGLDGVQGPLAVVAETARLVYYLAVVLLGALLVLILRRWRDRQPAPAAAVALFLGVALAARIGLVGDLVGTVGVLVAVGLLLAPAARAIDDSWRRLPLVAFGTAFLLLGLHTTAQLAVGEGLRLPGGSSSLLRLGEVLAVAGAIAAPVMVRGRDRGGVVVGVATAGLGYGLLLGGGATARVLMLWNLGVGGWLPHPAYAVAAGTIAYTLVAAVRAGRVRLACAMVLLTCGGLGLHSTYQSGLVVAGLAVLALLPRGSTVEHDRPRCTSRGSLGGGGGRVAAES